MSKKTISTILLVIGLFVLAMPMGIATLVLIKDEQAPAHKTIAIIYIVLGIINVIMSI